MIRRDQLPDDLKVTVVSEDEAETADYVVCMPVGPSPFVDNETGVCSKCGCAVMFRWHAPKRPPKVCLPCANKLMQQ